MLLGLIVKYFFRNRRRTYRAVAILTIGISLVLSTDMLMTGYINQIQDFASLIETPTANVIISLDYEQRATLYDQVHSVLRDYPIRSYLEMYAEVAEVQFDARQISVELLVANLTELYQNNWINLDPSHLDSAIYVSDVTDLNKELQDVQYIQTRETEFLLTNRSPITSLSMFFPDIYVDTSNPVAQNITGNLPNTLYFRTDDLSAGLIRDEIAGINGVQVLLENPSNQFLTVSAGQITQILILLQIGMSVLLILSISYVMVNLVQESEEDIRIMNMIGLDRFRIMAVFMGQSLMVAIASCVVSLFFSIMILYSVLPFITLLGLPYGLIALNPTFILITFVQALVVGFLSGIYPSIKGAGLIA